MSKSLKKDKKFICQDCIRLKTCKESPIAWVFFTIALIATISVRAVNLVLDFNPMLAKIFWYVGISGFTLFFIYKFRRHNLMHRQLKDSQLTPKLLSKQELSDHDYELLGTLLCQLSSKKDKINYFFIFIFSGLALLLAVYIDFLK
ncbi:MAG: hypothetical protein K9L86_06375 [Candidatus Omnitrophica bacterium]|nr:hypothetical protein [Candidatus Omnitrophota bacterium]